MFLANSFPTIIFLIAFLLGAIIVFFNLFLSYGSFKKLFLEKKELASDLFSLMIISSVLFAMVYMLRANSFEYRWFFSLLPGMLAFTSRGITKTADFINSFVKIKHLELILVIAILILGCYPQVAHTTNLIKVKVDSYSQVKDSGLWIKENSLPNDVIVSASITQHSYYTERKVIDFYVNGTNNNETAFDDEIVQVKPKYIIISIFEQGFTPQWAYTYAERHNNTLIPVKAYTMQTEQGIQPVLIVYEVKY